MFTDDDFWSQVGGSRGPPGAFWLVARSSWSWSSRPWCCWAASSPSGCPSGRGTA